MPKNVNKKNKENNVNATKKICQCNNNKKKSMQQQKILNATK